jgi:hypothetical protein
VLSGKRNEVAGRSNARANPSHSSMETRRPCLPSISGGSPSEPQEASEPSICRRTEPEQLYSLVNADVVFGR